MSSRNSNIKYQKKNYKINSNIPIGVEKPGPQYSPAIYTIDIAYKIDIPL